LSINKQPSPRIGAYPDFISQPAGPFLIHDLF
jgi:hypothetical protein